MHTGLLWFSLQVYDNNIHTLRTMCYFLC